MWLPPTPPSEDYDDSYVDTVLEMKYSTQSVICPAILASIAPFRYRNSRICYVYSDCLCSEEDYDVFGLRRQSADNGM